MEIINIRGVRDSIDSSEKKEILKNTIIPINEKAICLVRGLSRDKVKVPLIL